MNGYTELAAKFGKFWTSTDSGQKVELTEIDFGKMDQASKKKTLDALAAELKQFKDDVEKMANRIGPTKGCGYEFSSRPNPPSRLTRCWAGIYRLVIILLRSASSYSSRM